MWVTSVGVSSLRADNKLRSCARHGLGYQTMKNMKKFFLTLSLVIAGLTSANAQCDYLLNYGPGGLAWTWQMQQQLNAGNAYLAAMQQQTVNYYQQQAAAATQWLQTNPCQPMPGVMTYDGVYVTPETVNNYHKEQVECEHCDGGYNYRTIYLGGDRTRQSKTKCNWCHGNGYVTKTVKND